MQIDQFPRFRCHKEVRAVKIAEVRPGRADFTGPGATLIAEENGMPIAVSDEWVNKHDPEAGGYFVIYEDGYQSYSPAQAFESGYTRI